MMTDAQNRPTLTPAFLEDWPVERWRSQAEALAADDGAADRHAAANAGKMIRGAVQRELREKIEVFATDEVLPAIATAFEIPLEPAPRSGSDQALCAKMVARDVGCFAVLSPHWRAACSYRQLVQTRLWARAISEPLFEPFTQHVCGVEEAIAAVAVPFAAEAINPWLDELVAAGRDELQRQGVKAPPVDLAALTLWHVLHDLRDTVLRELVDAYDRHPALGRWRRGGGGGGRSGGSR